MEDVIDVSSRFPWWVGVALAVLSFVLLRTAAHMELTPIADPARAVSVGLRAALKGAAQVAQWVLPALFLIGAIVSVFKRRKRAALHVQAASAHGAAGLNAMTWQDFERLVGEYFRRRGFTVVESGGRGADGGVDLHLRRGSDRYLVQCKQWRALRVGVEPVRELYGVMAAQRVAGGFVVTSGAFTPEANRFAQGLELELIDGKVLHAAVRQQHEQPRAVQSGAAKGASAAAAKAEARR